MGQNTVRSLRVLELLRETDEEHPLTADRIVEKLDSQYNIQAERKAVYRDLADLCDCGCIEQHADKKRGWYMPRDFEMWQLKVLADAAQSAKFLNQTDTDAIVEKLYSLASAEERKALRLMTIPADAKRGNKGTKRAINDIFEAIRVGRKVSFRYVYTTYVGNKKQILPKHPGGTKPVSPYALIWRKDKYYLIGSYNGTELSYYRLDRIEDASVTDEPAVPLRDILGSDAERELKVFVKKNIYNSKGKNVRLNLRINANRVDSVIDSFGDGVTIIPKRDGTIDANVSVSDGEGLYTWLLHHLGECEVLQPSSVREELLRRLRAALAVYGE